MCWLSRQDTQNCDDVVGCLHTDPMVVPRFYLHPRFILCIYESTGLFFSIPVTKFYFMFLSLLSIQLSKTAGLVPYLLTSK